MEDKPAAPSSSSGSEIGRSRELARVLDDLVVIPGTRISLGADALLGLVPGVGDAATTLMSGLILVDAVKAQVPLPVLARMVLNCGVDAAVGQIPLVGDLADVAVRANRKNLRLLERAVADPDRVRRNSVVYLVSAIALVLLAVGLMTAGAVLGIWWLGILLGLWG